MTEMTVTQARARLADVVDAARVNHAPVYLTRRGQRVAAIIDADALDRLIEAAETWLTSRRPVLRPPGAKRLVGGDGAWRACTGDYRIVYEVRDEVLIVLVLAVGHPCEIYRGR